MDKNIKLIYILKTLLLISRLEVDVFFVFVYVKSNRVLKKRNYRSLKFLFFHNLLWRIKESKW